MMLVKNTWKNRMNAAVNARFASSVLPFLRGVSTVSMASIPAAMQTLNETYIAPRTCTTKIPATRHQRRGGDISEEGHFSPARHNSPDPQQDAATHKQVQHAQWKEHAFTGDAVKLTPHDKAEGKEKCGAQKIYGTFFHWNLPEVIFDRLSRLCIPSRWNTREKAA